MLRTALVLLPLALPLATTLQDAAPQAAATEDVYLLSFDWPQEGSVHVSSRVQKPGNDGSFDYTLRWAPDPADENLRVFRYADFELVEMNGQRKGDPQFETLNQAVSPVLGALPPFHVDAAGEFVGLVDLDGALDKMSEAYAELGDLTLDRITEILKDPAMRMAVENSQAEDWAWWGVFWKDYETTPGEAVTTEVSLPSGVPGQPLRGELTLTCVKVEQRNGEEAIRMRAITEYNAEDMKRLTLATLRSSTGAEVPENALQSVARVDKVVGLYTIDGLRPLEVRWSQEITVDDGRGEGPQQTVESKRWAFDWSK